MKRPAPVTDSRLIHANLPIWGNASLGHPHREFSLRILIAYVAEKLEHACLADEDGVDGREFSLMDGLADDDGDCGSVTAALSLPGEKKRR